MLDLRYLDHVSGDSLYYDHPSRTTGEDYPMTSEPVPHGWDRTLGTEWVQLAPTGTQLPAQGWKVHVSATLENAPAVLGRTWAYCRATSTTMKFVRSAAVLQRRNSKYGDRSASGKFITLYPLDDASLDRVLHELGATLEGFEGPYILSDVRWRTGPLYVRYGGFREMLGRGRYGEPVHCVQRPDGALVPDVRRPGFHPPPWVALPAAVAAAVDDRNRATLTGFPYRVQRALHFSNGGGVYVGTDTRSGATVLLKEARPLAGLDESGRDAVERLHREHWALERLRGTPAVPEPLELRVGTEHHFLVREFVDGVPLSEVVAERNPLLRPPEERTKGRTTGTVEYTSWALGVLDKIRTALSAMHSRGVVFNDLHPNNVLVTADDDIAFIDLETAAAVDDAAAPAMGAPGFRAPAGTRGTDVDRYALACVTLATFLPHTVMTVWGEAKTRQLVDAVAAAFPVPAELLARVREDLRLPGTDGVGWSWPASTGASRGSGAPSEADLAADRDAVVRGILSAATPERPDRLYPGDIGQLLSPHGGWGLAHGAAGVLWALHRAGVAPPAEHADRFCRAALAADAGPGLGSGFAGMALALDAIGRPEEAHELVERVRHAPRQDLDGSVLDGLSGVGLALLHLRGADAVDEVAAVADELVRFTEQFAPRRPGLVHGHTGHALLLVRLYERDGDEARLDRAGEALRRDLAALGWGAEEPRWHRLHGLAGAVGTAAVIAELLRHRPDSELREAAAAFRASARARFIPGTGLVTGRAGTMLALQHLSRHLPDPVEDTLDRAAQRQHQADLGWNAVPVGDGVGFLGEHGLKLSTDLATGSAGVLLALSQGASDPAAGTPGTEHGRPPLRDHPSGGQEDATLVGARTPTP